MNIGNTMTHAIVYLSGQDATVAPGSIQMLVAGAERANGKAEGFRSLKRCEFVVVDLDDAAADPQWKGAHATPRQFFAAEYDDGGIPRAWIVQNALR